MLKHAYLIMAHNDPYVFHKLISLLDDERNDIFVHIDKKSDLSRFNNVKTEKATYTLQIELIIVGEHLLRLRQNYCCLEQPGCIAIIAVIIFFPVWICL